MKKHIVYLSCCVALSGCLQENKAPVAYKEGVFYGRDGYYDRGGNELPKYNNYNRAELPPEQDAKYVNDNQHSYGVSAEVGGVSSADLPPPTEQPATPPPPVVVQEPTSAPTPADSPFVPEGVVPTTQPQTRLEWQRKQDNAVSEYNKRELEAQEEAEQVQRAAKEELQAATTQAAVTAPAVDSASLVPAGIADAATEKKAQAEAAYNEALAEKEAAAAIAAQTEVAPPAPVPAVPETPKKESFVWPLKGKVIKDFANDAGEGVVIAGRVGEPVRSSASGVVVHVGNKLKSYGNMIIIQHPDGYVTTYAHLSETVVSMDDNVVGGQLIGFVGKTGDAPQPQLHFAIRHNTEPLDPTKMVK